MDCETRIIKGWLVGPTDEVEQFHEATNYKYEDFVHSADVCGEPYFIGDEIGSIPGGYHMECDEMNMLIFNPKAINIEGGITDENTILELRTQLANAGYIDSVFFDEPRIYILTCMMY